MNKLIKIITSILFSFSFIFICVGYATLYDSFTITGKLEVKPLKFEGIYISSVKEINKSNVSFVSYEHLNPTNLKTDVNASNKGASVTYEVTVHNNSSINYWYLGLTYDQAYEKNPLIGANNGIIITTKDGESNNSSAFDTSDWVPADTYRTFYVTYTYNSNALGYISTFINFKFGVHMDSVQDEFLKVLNDKNSKYGYYYLVDSFENQLKETGKTTIGNVGDDKVIFDNVFGGNLTVNVNGEEKPVTIIISRKDIDNNPSSGDNYSNDSSKVGCEYTLYVTVDNLNNSNSSSIVYAVSYTCGPDGTFYQIGELYEGTCDVTDYDTTNNTYEGSFDITSWDATPKEYYVTDSITYKVGYEQGTEYDKYDTLEQLMSAKDNEFYNKVNNNSSNLLKPVCNILYSYRHNNGQYIESINESNLYNDGYNILKVAFDKIKPYCYIGNGAQEVKLANASSLSRAELIPLLEAIQKAYDYYLEVNQ